MSKTDNERIHEWLGNCWHTGGGLYTDQKCNKCSVRRLVTDKDNPKYDTDPAAAIALLEAVKSKGYVWSIESSNGIWWTFILGSEECSHRSQVTASADTLPAAIAKAVIALIEQETK